MFFLFVLCVFVRSATHTFSVKSDKIKLKFYCADIQATHLVKACIKRK